MCRTGSAAATIIALVEVIIAMMEAVEPVDVRLSEDGRSLEIDWTDGHTTTTTLHNLRWKCPCAECSGEMGYQGRLAGLTELPANEYVIQGVQPIGRYALAPVWESGHDSGLYPYSLLRSLCECPEHSARRREAERGDATGASS